MINNESESKPNGSTAGMGTGKQPRRRKAPATRTLFDKIKAHSTVIVLLAGFTTQIFLTGRWTASVEKDQQATQKEVAEIKMALLVISDDLQRASDARIEDVRQASFIRAQNEVLGKQLSAIQATLDAR